jgi:hypothetical protein
VDNHSAFEKLSGKAAAPTGPAAGGSVPREPVQGGPVQGGADQDDVDAEARRIEEEILGRPSSRPAPSAETRRRTPAENAPAPRPGAGDSMVGDIGGMLGGALGGGLKSMARSIGTQLGRELLRGVFGTSSRHRRR